VARLSETLAPGAPLKLLDRLIFVKDAVRPHDGNNIHGYLLKKPKLIIAEVNRGIKKATTLCGFSE
jgi:hypothetical protein